MMAADEPAQSARVLVVGEVLWDEFPGFARLGGAPLNFAVQLKRLGHAPLLVSGVGTDTRGEGARRAIADLGLDTRFVQSTAFPTGTATVRIGSAGQPSFAIERPSAYDAIQLSGLDVQALTTWEPAWLYFGTLFPSHPQSRAVLTALLDAIPNASRFYDLNVRPDSDSPALIAHLLRSSHVVKLNEAELHLVQEAVALPPDREAFCRAAVDRYGWRAVCVTLGARGCAMLAGGEYVEADGFPVEVADTVGAGDAFAAAFLHGLASGWPVAKIAEFSNWVGAAVASIHGAIPNSVPDAMVSR